MFSGSVFGWVVLGMLPVRSPACASMVLPNVNGSELEVVSWSIAEVEGLLTTRSVEESLGNWLAGPSL